MNKKLKEILDSIALSEEDTEKFGEDALDMVKNSKVLHDPNNNFSYLIEFLLDTIQFLEIEFEYTKKYSPEIFHSNVSLSRKFEIEIYQKILTILKK